MTNQIQHCSFCGATKEQTKVLISNQKGDKAICNKCVQIAKSKLKTCTTSKVIDLYVEEPNDSA